MDSRKETAIPLQTTSELYSALTEVIVGKQLVFDETYSPAISADYVSYVDVLKTMGRRINLTISDGNCLFCSLSKGVIVTEKYHHHLRSIILGFIYVNSENFLLHIEQKQ